MGKNKHYLDDYTGDVKLIRKSHKKFRLLIGVLCATGIVAAGSATYVLMNPAQTMTKEGIDEMDPNEDFIVTDEDTVLEDAIPAEDIEEDEEDLDAIPLIEEADEDEKDPSDAVPVEEKTDAPQDAVLPGDATPEADTLAADIEETETESEMMDAEAVEEAEVPESEVAAADEIAAPESEAAEIVGTSEEGETFEASASEETVIEIAPESESTVVEEVQTEAPAEEAAQTELTAEEAEADAAEAEETAETEEAAEESEETVGEAEVTETEKPAAEAESEEAESETQASEIREKSKDEVYVETEGEPLDEKWIDSVGLEVRTQNGWNAAETGGGETIEVDADQTLRFRVIYTVQPGTLSAGMRTLIYQIPKEITKVDESYGEIVDAQDRILAYYAIEESGLIRVTFTEDIAAMNEAGTKVTCQIEFRTEASNLAQ